MKPEESLFVELEKSENEGKLKQICWESKGINIMQKQICSNEEKCDNAREVRYFIRNDRKFVILIEGKLGKPKVQQSLKRKKFSFLQTSTFLDIFNHPRQRKKQSS